MVSISGISVIYGIIILVTTILTVACLRMGTKLNLRWLTVKGRLNRQSFIFAYLASSVLIVFNTMAILEAANADNLILFLTMLVAMAMFIAINMSVSMRRVQDLGYPGWYYVVAYVIIILGAQWFTAISYLQYIISAYLIFFRGTIGTNVYGEDTVK